MKKFLLIDTDCGVDDAQAVMMALGNPSIEVLGITCTYGNTLLENTCRNVLRVLQVCNKLEIPVYPGASAPILGGPVSGALFHGKDGLGDVPDPNAPGIDLLQKENAVTAILRIANERPAKGNIKVCGEFNFATDPEAAYIVLNEYTCPMYIAAWEFTCACSLSWEFYHEWVNQNTEKAMFMKKIFAHSFKMSKSRLGFVSCDSYAMAAAIDENFVTEVTVIGVSVELSGSLTRGMMVMDWSDHLKKDHKAFVMKNCDLGKFQALMMAALK